MHLSDALSKINENHPDGAVEFYAKMKEDPWQKAHDTLENQLKSPGFDPKVAVQGFYAEIRRLQDLFRQSGVSVKAHPWNVGWHSPNQKVGAARFAANEKCCIVCMTKEKLTFIRVEGKVTPCCAPCVEKLQASNEQMPLF